MKNQVWLLAWTKSAQAPVFCDYPFGLEKPLNQLLEVSFPKGLFKHQVEAINAVLSGENVLITTGTSSGEITLLSGTLFEYCPC